MDKILSIIVPSYNMEAFLDRSLSSLIVGAPLMERLEVLVVNDGSKDRTSEIAHGYESRFPGTFRVIDKANGHYGSCVNAGLAQASGKYVKVLDADDYFGERFADYLAFLTTVDADLILSDYVEEDEKGNILRRKVFHTEHLIVQHIGILANQDELQLHHARIAYRIEMLRKLSYHQTEGISYTDLEWDTLPLASVSSYAYYPKVLYRYLRGREGQSIDISYQKKNMWMKGKVLLGLADRYESLKRDLDPLHQSILLKSTLGFIQHHYYEYLLLYPKVMNEDELKSFDKELLNTSKEIHCLLETSEDIRKFGKFRYISDFRRNGTRKSIKYFYFDACTAIGSIFRELRRK